MRGKGCRKIEEDNRVLLSVVFFKEGGENRKIETRIAIPNLLLPMGKRKPVTLQFHSYFEVTI